MGTWTGGTIPAVRAAAVAQGDIRHAKPQAFAMHNHSLCTAAMHHCKLSG